MQTKQVSVTVTPEMFGDPMDFAPKEKVNWGGKRAPHCPACGRGDKVRAARYKCGHCSTEWENEEATSQDGKSKTKKRAVRSIGSLMAVGLSDVRKTQAHIERENHNSAKNALDTLDTVDHVFGCQDDISLPDPPPDEAICQDDINSDGDWQSPILVNMRVQT